MPHVSTVRRTGLALATVALIAAGCGDDDGDAAGGVEVDNAWARTSPMSAEAGAVYMDLTAEETTSLVGATVPSDVAGTVEIHETVAADMDDMGDMGAMTMQQVDSVTLTAGETVSLEPGGLHVMLLDLPDPLESGEQFDLTLTLENGDEIDVSVEVLDEAP